MENIALIPDNPSPDMIQKLFSKEGKQWARERVLDFVNLMAYYRCAMMEIETKLNVLNVEFSLQHDRNPINSIKTRLKSPISIREKMERRGIAFTMENLQENLHDVAGVRVVCSFPDDVYMLADALLALADALLEVELLQAARPRLHAMTADTAKQAMTFFMLLVCSIYFSLSSHGFNYWTRPLERSLFPDSV